MCQDLEGAELGVFNEGGRVVAAGFDAAHLEGAVLEGPEVAVGHGDARLDARRQERQPTVDALQGDVQPGARLDLRQERVVVRPLRRPGLVDPQPVDVQVQDAEAALLDDLLGAQQHLAPVGGDGLVGLDAAEAGVLVAQVTEAGDQQPLVGRVAAAEGFLAPVALGQGAHQGLVAGALLEQRGQRLGDQPLPVAADGRAELGHGHPVAAFGPDGLGRDVEVDHDARDTWR